MNKGSNWDGIPKKPSGFREAFNAVIASDDHAGDVDHLVQLLDSQFHQCYVTAGILRLMKLRLYDLDLNLVVQSHEGLQTLPPTLPASILEKARTRKGAERYKPLGAMWLAEGTPIYSVLVPVGGLRVRGYHETVLDPAFNLTQVTDMIQVPLQITTTQGGRLVYEPGMGRDHRWRGLTCTI